MKIIFYCGANNKIGYGHFRRCYALGRILAKKYEHDILFKGNFDCLYDIDFKEMTADYKVIRHEDSVSSDLIVIDTMFDNNDMEYYPYETIKKISNDSKRIAVICSSMELNCKFKFDFVIGHLLSAKSSANYYTGLKYCPVDTEFVSKKKRKIQKIISTIFISFGSFKDHNVLLQTLTGLQDLGFKGVVQILISPIFRNLESFVDKNTYSYEIIFLLNVQCISDYIKNNDLVIGCYGNLAFEAMSLGLPYVAINFKDFQNNYSDYLEQLGLLKNLGLSHSYNSEIFCYAIKELNYKNRLKINRACLENIDGNGISRICKVINRNLN